MDAKDETLRFVSYSCRNCRQGRKIYALALSTPSETAVKFGELPAFGTRTSPKLKALIESDRDRYIKGLRSESLGLGIGAFAYYRQVVENIKTQIFEQIIEVAKLRSGHEELIAELEAAKIETQFSKATGKIRHALPDSLLTLGHSPLDLLHNALSEGLHGGTDDECLELAHTIRGTLEDFAEKVSVALSADTELENSVKKLLEKTRRRAETKKAV